MLVRWLQQRQEIAILHTNPESDAWPNWKGEAGGPERCRKLLAHPRKYRVFWRLLAAMADAMPGYAGYILGVVPRSISKE